MRFRKLRIAWSVLCAIACVLLIALWLWSYWRKDTLHRQREGMYYISLVSVDGRLILTSNANNLGGPFWAFRSEPRGEPSGRPRFSWRHRQFTTHYSW
jgi:hypothetical protein